MRPAARRPHDQRHEVLPQRRDVARTRALPRRAVGAGRGGGAGWVGGVGRGGGALTDGGCGGRDGAAARPGGPAGQGARGRAGRGPHQPRAHARRRVPRERLQRDAAGSGAALLHRRGAAPAGPRAAAPRAGVEARPHERAAARAPLRPDRVPQRGDLLRPADAGATVPGLRRGARAGRHPAARQGRDAVRGGARAPRPRGAAGTHLSPAAMSPAPKETIVKGPEWAVERGDAGLVPLRLGACVALMVHAAAPGAGGLAHTLLPSRSLAHDATNPTKFPDTAVPVLVERLRVLGADPRRLVAKLVGGASMFAQLMTPGSVQMGERNIVAARNALRAASIPLAREAVGGGAGRSVRFHVADGHVEIRTVGSDAIVI